MKERKKKTWNAYLGQEPISQGRGAPSARLCYLGATSEQLMNQNKTHTFPGEKRECHQGRSLGAWAMSSGKYTPECPHLVIFPRRSGRGASTSTIQRLWWPMFAEGAATPTPGDASKTAEEIPRTSFYLAQRHGHVFPSIIHCLSKWPHCNVLKHAWLAIFGGNMQETTLGYRRSPTQFSDLGTFLFKCPSNPAFRALESYPQHTSSPSRSRCILLPSSAYFFLFSWAYDTYPCNTVHIYKRRNACTLAKDKDAK